VSLRVKIHYLEIVTAEADAVCTAHEGAEAAHPPLEIPGKGTFAILFQGGVQTGLWQL